MWRESKFRSIKCKNLGNRSGSKITEVGRKGFGSDFHNLRFIVDQYSTAPVSQMHKRMPLTEVIEF